MNTVNTSCKNELKTYIEKLASNTKNAEEVQKLLGLAQDAKGLDKMTRAAIRILKRLKHSSDNIRNADLPKKIHEALMKEAKDAAMTARRQQRLSANAFATLKKMAEGVGNNIKSMTQIMSRRLQSKQLTNLNKYLSYFDQSLTKAGVVEQWKSNSFEAEVAEILFQKEKNFPDTVAGHIAKAVHDTQQLIRAELRDAGFPIGEIDNYLAQTGHDPDKMAGLTPKEMASYTLKPKSAPWADDVAAGMRSSVAKAKYLENRWVEFYMSRLDLDRSFPEVEGEEAQRRRLSEMYLDLTGARPPALEEPTDKIMSPPTFANRVGRRHRTLVYKSAADHMECQKRFGIGGLREAMDAAMTGASHKLSVTNFLGPNPEFNLRRLDAHLREKTRANSSMTDTEYAKHATNMKLMLDNAMGRLGTGRRNNTAKIFQIIRSGTALMTQWGVAANALMDPLIQHQYMRTLGNSTGEAMAQTVENFGQMLKGFNKKFLRKDEKDFLQMYEVSHLGNISAYDRFFDPNQPLNGLGARMMKMMYKVGGMTSIDHGLENGALISNALGLARQSAKEFADLPFGQRRDFELYGIGEHEWNLFRKNPTKGPRNRLYITPEAVLAASDEDIKSYLKSAYKTRRVTGAMIKTARAGLKQDLMSYQHDQVNNAVLRPDYLQQTTLKMRQGDTWGEMIGLMTQFKSWGMNYATRVVLGRIKAAQGPAEIAHAIIDVVSATVLQGIGLNYVRALMTNQPAPSPKNISTYAGALAPMLGVAGSWAQTMVEHPWTLASQMMGRSFGIGVKALSLARNEMKYATDPVYRSKHTQLELNYNFFSGNSGALLHPVIVTALAYGIEKNIMDGVQPGFLEKRQERMEKLKGEIPTQQRKVV